MPQFTPGELEVMRVLWAKGPLKPAELLTHLDRPLTNAALRSVLRVLLEKGHLTRRKVGKAYFYRPKRSAQAALKKMAGQLADIFFGGSKTGLIAQLIKTEELSDDDIRELQRIAETKDASNRSTGREKNE